MAQERKKSLISLKLLIKRLQNHLQQSRRIDTSSRGFECEEFGTNERVPDDVKEGHFAIVARNEDDKPTRFVVGLCVLKHPDFLKLLKMAEEEYGFQQRGALAVPCQPEELKRILQDKTWRRSNRGHLSIAC
ncbi:auxin-induced protein 10a5 [Phtheirospermum japonicum]|uniref:Auxin-induced protein 10a5 n=1 Tax=Phtheirospermum japonicum TaxID=374723 RepID=A0A830D4X7_9LAMI|nr:auxin-induced protein 10a5 [Phtheirospermum japonicum]